MQYGLMIFMAFGMYMTSGIWSFVSLNSNHLVTRADLNKTVSVYERNPAYGESWNFLQTNVCALL